MDTSNQRQVVQADRLVTNACENRRMLLEYEKEILPYSIKTSLKKSAYERDEIEAYLRQVLSDTSMVESFGSNRSPGKTIASFDDIHTSFHQSADNLCQVSQQLNTSLTLQQDE
jgi:hypothetical protein